jgi:hypothetical protein
MALLLTAANASAQGSISGTVYDSLSTRGPLANATVVLVERSRFATTDSRGRFQIDSVPDGHYTLTFSHPVLDSLGLEPPAAVVEVAGGRRTVVALATPTPAAAYALLCPGKHDTETGVLLGRVRDVDDHAPLAGAAISTDWTEFALTGGRFVGHRARAVAKTNASGIYLLCGVPKQTNLDVTADLAGAIAGPTTTSLDDRLVGRVDFAVSRMDSAARNVLRTDSSAAASSHGTAALRGIVRDGDGHLLNDALVGVIGTQRSDRTKGPGTFRIDGIPAGTRTVEVRSIGWQPLTFSIDFATNASRDTSVTLNRHVQTLNPVVVLGRTNSTSAMVNAGFDRRRKQGFGAFVTQADIAKHLAFDLTDVLAGIRGIHIEYGTNGYPVPFMRGSANGYCLPSFFLDDMPFNVQLTRDNSAPFSDLAALVPPNTIRGIEVYSSGTMIPPQYDRSSSTSCGSIVIWTH